MRFGVCCPLTDAGKIAGMSFDYIESNATVLSRMEEAAFREAAAAVEASGIRAEAFNCLFPAEWKILSPDVTDAALTGYLDPLFERIARVGGQVVVFGSGYARHRPEDMPAKAADGRLTEICRLLAERAVLSGLEIAIEPLNRSETNVVNTQEDARVLARRVGHPAFGVLADYYHMHAVGEGAEAVAADGPLLRHAHIAVPGTRLCPQVDDGVDYAPFFTGLAGAGYDRRLSFEGNAGDRDKTFPALLAFFREAQARYFAS